MQHNASVKSRGNYIRAHWRGRHSLARSFWINFLPLFCALNFAERFVQPPYLHGESAVTAAAIAFFIIVRLAVHPWQVVGVIRACERAMRDSAARGWAIAAEGVVVLSVIASLVAAFSSYQTVLAYHRAQNATATRVAVDGYTLDLVRSERNGELIHLRGTIAVGITRKVEHLLAAHPRIRGIILDSGGGQIYEGRGLAKLIREHRLTTFVTAQCDSACTTAFAAGVQRTLARGARLGFHQYKSYTALPVIDVDAEQAKDRALFAAQGISSAFLQKIFSQPPDQMWRPGVDELVGSGMVHGVVDGLR